jgi:hypothetical protein
MVNEFYISTADFHSLDAFNFYRVKTLVNIYFIHLDTVRISNFLRKSMDIEYAKNRLQEYCQQRYLPLPVYYTLEKTGPDHSPLFQVRSNM